MAVIAGDIPLAFLTKEGGIAFPMINATGATSIVGSVVCQSSTSDESFELAPYESDTSLGVVYNAVASGEITWIVRSGRAYVLLEENTGCARNQQIGSSTSELGVAAVAPSENIFGTTLQTVMAPGAGENTLVLAIISFGMGGATAGPIDVFGYFPTWMEHGT